MIEIRLFMEACFWILLFVSILLYQNPILSRVDRIFVSWMTLQFIGGLLAWTAVTEPEWDGFPQGAWTPIWQDASVSSVVNDVLIALYIPLALCFAGLLIARQMRGLPLDRYTSAPALVVVSLAGLASAVAWSIATRTTTSVALVLLPMPVAFIYGAKRLDALQKYLREALAQASAREPGQSRSEQFENRITDVFRQVLCDPTLTLAFWSAPSQGWVTESGRPYKRSSGSARRGQVLASRAAGQLIAVVDTVKTSPSAFRQVEAAVRAVAPELENAALRALVRAQLEEVKQAHARTLRAGMDERRRLEQDLHDGAQQRLLAVLTSLAVSRLSVNEQSAAHALSLAESEVRQALLELRSLARGLHPSTLVRYGLQAAFAEVTARLEIAAYLDISAERLGVVLESSIYFLICEALSNTVKHAKADCVWVKVCSTSGTVTASVQDDGVGGANLGGSGIRGMSDRVVALGGELRVISDLGAGTRIEAEFPCE